MILLVIALVLIGLSLLLASDRWHLLRFGLVFILLLFVWAMNDKLAQVSSELDTLKTRLATYEQKITDMQFADEVTNVNLAYLLKVEKERRQPAIFWLPTPGTKWVVSNPK